MCARTKRAYGNQTTLQSALTKRAYGNLWKQRQLTKRAYKARLQEPLETAATYKARLREPGHGKLKHSPKKLDKKRKIRDNKHQRINAAQARTAQNNVSSRKPNPLSTGGYFHGKQPTFFEVSPPQSLIVFSDTQSHFPPPRPGPPSR